MGSRDQKSVADKEFGLSYIIRRLSEDIDHLTKEGEEREKAIQQLQQEWAEWMPQIKKVVDQQEDAARRMKDLIWRIVSVTVIGLLAAGVAWYIK